MQPLDLLVRQRRAVGVGRQPRVVQDLVRIGAADAGDRALVAQERVQAVWMLLERAAQRGRVERRVERLRAEVRELGGGRLRRQQPDGGPALAARFAHRQLGAAGEPDREHRRLRVRRPHGEPPGGHQVKHQHGAVRRLEQQALGAAPDVGEAAARQRNDHPMPFQRRATQRPHF